MNMKKLIESMDYIEECGMTEMPAAMPAPENPGNPVTMSVSLNASGKEHVDDLINMMKNAGMGAAEPVSAKMLSPRMDMERLSGIMNAPESIEEGDDDMMDKLRSMSEDDILAQMELGGPMKDFIEKVYNQVSNKMGMGDMDAYDFDSAAPNFDKVHDEVMKMLGVDAKNEGDYANEPDARYGDMSDAIPDGNDLNRKKKSYAATQDGDNPMAVESDDNYVGAVEYHDGTTIYPKIGDTVELFYSDYTDSDDEADHKPNAVGKIVGKGKRDDETFIIKWKDNTTGNIEQDEFSAADEFYILNKDRSDPSRIKGRKQGELPMPGGKTNRRNVRNPAGNEDMVETIKSQLLAALQEKKGKPDFLDVDKDGDKKEPMKKALKDKGSKPKKGEVPAQFKKKTNEAELDEISSDLAKRYTKNAKMDRDFNDDDITRLSKSGQSTQDMHRRNSKRTKGISRAAKRIEK